MYSNTLPHTESAENHVAISIRNVSKAYQIYNTPSDRLRQFFVPRLRSMLGLRPKVYFQEFLALNNISFEVQKGETIGIIGRNGAGKSTLLQILCGTLSPSTGTVKTEGRIAALLELGSGFNPEFSGRENIYLNAAVLGLNKTEIEQRFDAIVAFAEIGDFIEQPVKTYSSGMYVRLAFAVIAHVDAQILIIDEALSVGDVFFQQKCMRHLRNFQNQGGTILFVSHDAGAVTSLCDKAVLLPTNKQESLVIGDTDSICQLYIKDLYDSRSGLESQSATQPSLDLATEHTLMAAMQPANPIQITPFRPDADSFGVRGATITDVWFEHPQGIKASHLIGGNEAHLCIQVQAHQPIHYAAFGFMLKDRHGQYLIAEGTDLAYRTAPISLNSNQVAVVRFSFLMPILIQGTYALNVAMAEGMGHDHVQHHWINDALSLQSLDCRLVHGICGLQDLQICINVSSAAGVESS